MTARRYATPFEHDRRNNESPYVQALAYYDSEHRNMLAHHAGSAFGRQGWRNRGLAEELEAPFLRLRCAVCNREAPLVGGECPECRH